MTKSKKSAKTISSVKTKKKITYDSQETSTLIGLIFLLVGAFFGISIFTETSDSASLFFTARTIFGDATIVFAMSLSFIGLRFLGAKLFFNSIPATISQIISSLIISGLLITTTYEPLDIPKLNPVENVGGRLGFWLITSLLGDTIPTEPFTTIILASILLIVIPSSFGISFQTSVKYITSILNWIWAYINYLFITGEEVPKDIIKVDKKTKNNEVSTPKELSEAKSFGELNKILTSEENKQVEEKPEKKKSMFSFSKKENTENKDDKKTIQNLNTENNIKTKKVEPNVEVLEGELGEDGLNQNELRYPNWKLPPLNLLIPFKKEKPKDDSLKRNADVIEQILKSFNIEAKVEESFIGPAVIQYALDIPLGIKVNKIATLSENIALALGVDSKAVRIESIPGTTFLGIEVPRENRDMVRFKELMSSDLMGSKKFQLPVTIGKDIHGEAQIGGIEKMPHLLIAGATGSGKSVLTNSFITSLIMAKTPDELKFILVDPKQVELSDYNGIPHLLTPVITDMDQVVNALKWAVNEMEQRYSVLAKIQVRNIEGYNEKKGFAAMPYIVIVIDEMADMMMTANRVEAENAIVRLAQKARAVGIHLILATQRPSVNVITGIIKANIPGRVGMSVTSSTDSRVIIDRMGAESLQGKGDLLYKAPDKTKAERLQCAFIDQKEVIAVVDFIKAQAPEVEYISEITEKQLSSDEEMQEALGDISGDTLIEQAIRLVARTQKGSASYLQRRLSIGFNRAARLLDELEEAGVVGAPNGSKPREVLITDADSFIKQLKS